MPFLKNIDPNFGNGQFLIGENDPNLSNEQVTLLAHPAADYLPGTVLGKVTASGKYVPVNAAAADGSQNFAGILYGRRDANAADERAVAVVRRQVVNANLLIWVNAATQNQKDAIAAQAAAAMVMFRK